MLSRTPAWRQRMQFSQLKRREFLPLLGAPEACPLAVRAGAQAINLCATGLVARSCKLNLGGHVCATALTPPGGSRLGYPTVFALVIKK
jgi:hypothetical protein